LILDELMLDPVTMIRVTLARPMAIDTQFDFCAAVAIDGRWFCGQPNMVFSDKRLSSPLLDTQFSPQTHNCCADGLANLSHADF
jgi:hypothetical protein